MELSYDFRGIINLDFASMDMQFASAVSPMSTRSQGTHNMRSFRKPIEKVEINCNSSTITPPSTRMEDQFS